MPIIYAINDFALRHRWLSFTPSTPKRPLFFPQTHCPTSPSPSTLRQQRHNSLPTTPSTSFALINAIMSYRNSTPATPSTSFAIFNTKLNSVSFAPSFHSCQRQFSHLRPTLESSKQIPHFLRLPWSPSLQFLWTLAFRISKLISPSSTQQMMIVLLVLCDVTWQRKIS